MTSRTVHPAYVPVFPATGVEFSCWAYVTSPRPTKRHGKYQNRHKDTNENQERNYPNLITAQGSTIRIYKYSPPPQSDTNLDTKADQKKQPIQMDSLFLLKSYQINGMVCSLDTLPHARSRFNRHGFPLLYDGLLIGFAGNPRLAIVYPELHELSYIESLQSNLEAQKTQAFKNHLHMERLQSSSIIDLTPALWDRCKGATSPLDQDLYVSICYENRKDYFQYDDVDENDENALDLEEEEEVGKPSVAAIVLGGGVCVAAFSFLRGPVPTDDDDIDDEEEDEKKDDDQENDTADENGNEKEEEVKQEKESQPNENVIDNDGDTKANDDNKLSSNRKTQNQEWWLYASEPYLIDLHALSRSVASFQKSFSLSSSSQNSSILNTSQKYGNMSSRDKTKDSNANQSDSNEATSFSTTWGEILSLTFLDRYSSPTLAILHTSTSSSSYNAQSAQYGGNSQPGASNSQHAHKSNATVSNGIWAGRMTKTSAFKYSCTVTALAISVEQSRSVVIWSTQEGTCPCDARFIKSIPKQGGCCVVSPNGLMHIPHGGTFGSSSISCERPSNGDSGDSNVKICSPSVLACNGFAHATIAASKHPNPKPLPLLNIHLDGCRMEFINENVAMLINQDGRVYSVELHSQSSLPAKSKSVPRVGDNKKSNDSSGRDEILVLSCTPLSYRMEEGACSTLSVFPLWRWTGTSDNGKRNIDRLIDDKQKGEDELEKWAIPDLQGIGLVFCGSRFGDSVLLAYHYEHLQLKSQPNEVYKVDNEKTTTGMKRKLTNQQEDGEQYDGRINPKNSVRLKIDHEMEDNATPPTTVSSSTIEIHPTSESKPTHDYDLDINEDCYHENEHDVDEESRLLQEERELYEGYTTNESPNIISDSDEDSCSYNINLLLAQARENTQYGSSKNSDGTSTKASYPRPTINSLTVFSALASVHTLSAPGPLGPSCRGPSRYPGEDMLIMPCGYGRSGGVLMMHPIVDGRNIQTEIDMRGIQNGWIFNRLGYVLFGMKGNLDGRKGILMRLDTGKFMNDSLDKKDVSHASFLHEVNVDDWTVAETGIGNDKIDTPRKILQENHILAAKEWCLKSLSYLVIVAEKAGLYPEADSKYYVFILDQAHSNQDANELQIIYSAQLGEACLGEKVVSLTTLEDYEEILLFGCIWSNGKATTVTITSNDMTKMTTEQQDPVFEFEITESVVPNPSVENEHITAMDIFCVNGERIFPSDDHLNRVKKSDKMYESMVKPEIEEKDHINSVSFEPITKEEVIPFEEESLEAEDLELYGLSSDPSSSLTKYPYRSNESRFHNASKQFLYIATCTSSNKLQIHDSSLNSLLWQASGCGHGIQILSPLYSPPPATETILRIIELRFFYCGESTSREKTLCCAMLTDKFDLQLYRVTSTAVTKENPTCFYRISLGNIISRPSLEEKRYKSKLVRKGMLPKTDSNKSNNEFRNNKLHRFYNISQYSGLFVSVSRPLWIVMCDGRVVGLYHKMRHAAPAGQTEVPISVFLEIGQNHKKCDKDYDKHEDEIEFSGLGFMTVHERLGRVGSQRLTIYDRIFELPSQKNSTLYPDGSGMLLTKIPFGVTVRQIAYFDNYIYSTASKPLFLLLISHELELDQSFLNDDGLTPEERQHLKEEREREKTRRQVEADLGGFDVEQEWVEEIEREDIFEVDTELGGAPKIHVEKHEVWLVQGGKEWNVVDKYELNDFEHGTTLKVMNLTNEIEEGGNGAASSGASDQIPQSPLFVAVGTGIVDKDGEDIGSKGRVLLFEVKRRERSVDREKNNLQISLTYEKDIILGPVTSLGCLSCDGKSRIVVGAGAEVTVEQWGEDKLTQVGFFHANMQVQDIVLFKTFFLLSDAYDSLHFLVWRESDKSLTLLAKDYEPTAMYSVGTISRGGSMAFVCHDDRQNFKFLQYAPKDEAARGGNKLVCRSDFHTGLQTVSLQSHWCQSSVLVSSSTPHSTFRAMKQQDPLLVRGDDYQRFAVHFGTTDGGISVVVPVSERTYWRLTALQSVMSNALESNCALSHRAWRLYRRSSRRGGCRSNDRKKGVLDGILLFQYIGLGMFEQEQLASAIGSSVDVIMDNLLELDSASRV